MEHKAIVFSVERLFVNLIRDCSGDARKEAEGITDCGLTTDIERALNDSYKEIVSTVVWEVIGHQSGIPVAKVMDAIYDEDKMKSLAVFMESLDRQAFANSWALVVSDIESGLEEFRAAIRNHLIKYIGTGDRYGNWQVDVVSIDEVVVTREGDIRIAFYDRMLELELVPDEYIIEEINYE